MQVNLNLEDLNIVLEALKTTVTRTKDANRAARLLTLIGRFAREIEEHPAKYERALEASRKLKRERKYPDPRRLKPGEPVKWWVK